ncbi:hypothetical protein HMPREF1051_1274 [Neisseria sicca VK64]|uniref:Uncharacterized protein n=1 Tax=Neisseria sicca VK64 TaxID=1095748 RepID=I2NX63_NEISI|nr:hypothetical protein HMPREF1051_1274 [Neisseria sicca VK64]
MCFNTQPPEGGWRWYRETSGISRSFNTQPPEGGWISGTEKSSFLVGFNTQPPEGGWDVFAGVDDKMEVFQHTAA